MKYSTLLFSASTLSYSTANIDTGHSLRETSDNLRRLKSGKAPKSTTKSSKALKSSKEGKSKNPKAPKSSKGDQSTGCVLPVIKGAGAPHWVQTGQVMTQFEDTLVPRKTFTSKSSKGSRTIQNNDQYMVQCAEQKYLADEMCVVTCIDGTLDTTKYCGKKPEDICVLARELTYIKECPLNFDSDAPWHDGKSLKAWWKEVIDRYYLSGKEIFEGTADIPFYLGHGTAFLEGYGLSIQTFGPMGPAAEKSLNGEAVEITGWISEGYEYGPDDQSNSATLPNNAYVQDIPFENVATSPEDLFQLPKVNGPVNFPNPKLKTMSLIGDTYDPCDESTYLGFPRECFLYHPAGYHLGNGKMLNFLSPLSNGDIDILGVCTADETIPPIHIPALIANYANVAELIKASGGLIATHPVSNSLHLCIDGDDIYHPRLCPWHTDDADIDAMIGEPLQLNARPFIVENSENDNQTILKKKTIYGNNDKDKKQDGKSKEDKKKSKSSCIHWEKKISNSTDTHVEDRLPMNKNITPVCNPTYAEITRRKVRKKLED